MADPKLCSIPDCGKPHMARGWCNAHYLRWKVHGDPLGGGTYKGEARRYYEETVLTYDGNDCLTWPYTRNTGGYGMLDRESVHRLVCEKIHGPAPTPKHHAAHSCGKGHEACCAKRHLSWKTPTENSKDRIFHGTDGRGERQSGAKLTEADVLAIRQSTDPRRAVAAKYSITPDHVYAIRRRIAWGWLD